MLNFSYLVPVENLGDAAVADAQLATDDAGADAGGGQLHDLQANVVRQWSAVDEDAAELVHSPLAYKRRERRKTLGSVS